jgi:diguanylate cyclase (GGDEF)-like protein
MEITGRQGTVSVAGAARILGVHPNTVRAWSDQGRLPFMRINSRGDRRYRASALEAFLGDAGSGREPQPPDAREDAALAGRDGGTRLPLASAIDQLVARIGATLDAGTIERDLLDRSMELFAADRGAIFLREQDGAAVAQASNGLSRAYLSTIQADFLGSRVHDAINAGRAVAMLHWGADMADHDRQRQVAAAEGFESLAVAPLVADGTPLGALVLYHDRPRPYDERELEALRMLGAKAGVAIRNARDYARMATWAAQLRSIQQLGVRLSRLGTLREVGAAIATELQELIDYHNVRVYRLVNQTELVPVSMRGRVGQYVDETPEQLGTTLGHGLTGWVAEHRQALLVHDAAHDPRSSNIPGTDPGLEESMLLAPMTYEDEVLGVLVLSKLGLRQFTEDDLRLLEIYASLAAQAMANVDSTDRLRQQYAQMARWAAQLRSIQQLGVRLSRLSSVGEIGIAIATELRQLIDYHNVRVYRLLPGGDLVAVAMRGQVGEYVDETPEQLRVHVGEGITGWVAEHRQAQLVDDAAADPRVLIIPGTQADLDESMLLAPMVYEDEVLGVLVLSKVGLRQFSQDDLRLLEIYASFAAHAMASADAAERLRDQSASLARQLRSQQVLLQITESILTTLDARRVLDQIAEGLAALVRYDNLAIADVDPSTGLLRTIVAIGVDAGSPSRSWLPWEEELSTWVVRRNEPLLVREGRNDPRARNVPGLEQLHGSIITVPLRGRSGPTGVLTLERLGTADRFTDEEFELVKLFGAQVSIALQNAEEHRAVEIRAETDGLTGLRNKATFDRQLAQAVAHGDPFSVVMVDLDDFKAVNDAQGHQAGDAVLRHIAAALRNSVRDTDVVFRYGGDEFTLLLPGTDAAGAWAVADKVSRTVGAVESVPGARPVTCSIGIASYPADGADPDAVLLAADRACYASKRSGRGRISTAREGLELVAEFRLTTPTPVDRPVVVGP